MDFKFSKDSGSSPQLEEIGEKKKQSVLLVFLLVLVGAFTYLYFFTGLIKPQEAIKLAEAPAPESQVVKMPLPTREGVPVKPDGQATEKTEAPKVATPSSTVASTPVAKPVPAPTEPAPPPAAKPADNKRQPLPVTSKKADLATAGKAETRRTAKGPWSLMVGNYVLEETLSADMGRVLKAGFKPVIKPSSRKKAAMNRLFVSEFSDRASAQSTLETLKRITSDAFVIDRGGRFTVYAGSYLLNEAAISEKERLKLSGISVTIKHIDIAIPSKNLSVGPFKRRIDADSALARLKTAGIKATLTQK